MTANRFNFRVWDKTYNQLFYDAQDTYDFTRGTPIPIMADSFGELIEDTENFHLMQSTGIVDKNGKEIFEGDIIEFSTFKVVVKWEDCRFKIKSSCCDLALDIIRAEKCEVLGNIYENKELLGE